MGKRRWTPWERKKVIDLFAAGKTTQQIAEDYGITRYTLSHMCRKYGIQGPRKYHIWTVNEERKLLDDYRDGMEIEAIMKKYGITRYCLKTRMYILTRRLGVDPYIRRKRKTPAAR